MYHAMNHGMIGIHALCLSQVGESGHEGPRSLVDHRGGGGGGGLASTTQGGIDAPENEYLKLIFINTVS